MYKSCIYPVLTLVLLFVLHGCYEDLGNYEYDIVNRIGIDLGNNGFLDQYLSDTLVVDPVLTFDGAVETDISFTWYCNGEEISSERKLVIPVKELKGNRPYIKLKVVNNRDESTFLKGFYIDIIPDFMNGWVVLSREGARTQISFINPVTFSVYHDFYTLITDMELGPNAFKIQEKWPFDALSIGSILVTRADKEGNIEINGEDLNPLYNTNDFFLAKTPPEDFRSNGEFYMWDYSFMLDDNGNLYQRKHDNNKLFQSGVYSNRPMYIPGAIRFDKGWAGPWMSGLTLFYDKTGGKLYVGSDFGSVMEVSFVNVFPGMPGDFTYINNMDKELVYVGNVKQGRFASPFYMIYKDEGGGYWVQKIQVVHQGTFIQVIHMGEKLFGEGLINDNTVFCQLDRKEPYMFFSGGADNKTLYMYEHTTSRLTEYYSLDSGIRTISADLSNASNNILMVGLESGEMVLLGITYQDMTEPDGRYQGSVQLPDGVPESVFYKCGYQYSQF